MNDYEAEETKREAAVALSHFSYVAMYALADRVTPAEARESLISIIAGEPPQQEPPPPPPAPASPKEKKRPGRTVMAPLNLAAPSFATPVRSLLANDNNAGPIIAYVRQPRRPKILNSDGTKTPSRPVSQTTDDLEEDEEEIY